MTQNAPQTEAAQAAQRAAWQKKKAERQAAAEAEAVVRPPAGPAVMRPWHRLAIASFVVAELLPTLVAAVGVVAQIPLWIHLVHPAC